MPSKRSTPKILHRAGELRKNTTPAEKKLWAHLRLMREDGIRFRRQHAIGTYITDFCAPRRKIIIELDGSQHLEQEEYDAERTAFLESKGYRVLRFWNNDVMNDIEGVLRAIALALENVSLDLEIVSEQK
jgi:very-short-patch-repair endonuclease